MEFYLLGILFFLGFVFGAKDFRRHFLLLYVLIIYFICFFLGPLNSINLNWYTHLGGNFSAGFYETLQLYALALFFFLLAYSISFKFSNFKRKVIFYYQLNSKHKYYMWFFFISLVSMIRRNFEENVYGGGFYNYLAFLGDSLILAFIVLIYEKKFSKTWHWLLLGGSLLAYMVLGFRYRILLLIIGVIYHFAVTSNLSFKTVIKWIAIGCVVAYAINFITLNREALRTLEFQDVTFESKTQYGLSPYQMVLQQTDNYKTEMMVVKYIRDNNIEPDYGESMFTHIFIRIIPASFFENDKKPEIPQMNVLRNSFNSIEGYYAGAAVSNVIEYYIAFGVIGIIFFMSLLGSFLGYIAKKTNFDITRDRVINAMIAMVLFQELTRGYLPQNITLLAFLLITLKLFYKKRHASSSNEHTNTL
ncbi:O-antigen polysaccharide polymerase Wzy [Flavobacterium sp. RSP49]|uniref:O-antigen polymerase n=1 Tax=Flavobacterium sp. RSP49 TaxID=2497487 RepID=UPI000F84C9C4|nr:O-antigen polymerase [Flavobacterium sp. RSP49]RTZ00893.1 O-antigen polysaccharide polymerase Wzy [Flavobacterium sp. RSP49]